MDLPLSDSIATRLPLCFVLALIVALLLYLLIKRTVLGFELRAVGSNRKAAQYAGIPSGRIVVVAMVLSGCCAGLAGVTYYLGHFDTIEPGTLTSVGFDSIAVALLANSNPIACVLSTLLITVLTYGSTYMSSVAGVSAYIAQLMVGIVLLFCACGAYLKYRIERGGRRAPPTEPGGALGSGSGSGPGAPGGRGGAGGVGADATEGGAAEARLGGDARESGGGAGP
jgi:ABC-type uncharacterized transport system permease subunit